MRSNNTKTLDNTYFILFKDVKILECLILPPDSPSSSHYSLRKDDDFAPLFPSPKDNALKQFQPFKTFTIPIRKHGTYFHVFRS